MSSTTTAVAPASNNNNNKNMRSLSDARDLFAKELVEALNNDDGDDSLSSAVSSVDHHQQDLDVLFRETRALITMNQEIWTNCQPYWVRTSQSSGGRSGNSINSTSRMSQKQNVVLRRMAFTSVQVETIPLHRHHDNDDYDDDPSSSLFMDHLGNPQSTRWGAAATKTSPYRLGLDPDDEGRHESNTNNNNNNNNTTKKTKKNLKRLEFKTRVDMEDRDFGPPPMMPEILTKLIPLTTTTSFSNASPRRNLQDDDDDDWDDDHDDRMVSTTFNNRNNKDDSTNPFPNYADYFEKCALLQDKVLIPFLAHFRRHLESVQVFLGAMESWLLVASETKDFLTQTFRLDNKNDNDKNNDNNDKNSSGRRNNNPLDCLGCDENCQRHHPNTKCLHCGEGWNYHFGPHGHTCANHNNSGHHQQRASFALQEELVLAWGTTANGEYHVSCDLADGKDRNMLTKFMEYSLEFFDLQFLNQGGGEEEDCRVDEW